MRRLLGVLILSAVVTTSSVTAPAQARESEARKIATGRYTGTETPEEPNGFDDIVFTFDVRKKKEKLRIRNFTIAMNVVCSGYPLYTEYVVQPMNTMRVSKRTGKFKDVVTGQTEGGTTYRVEVSGRLKGKKVTTGRRIYDVGICQRGDRDDPIRWIARKGRG